MKTYAVGDIHGCLTALNHLLEVVGPASEDRLVFLGDYIDRGPDSRKVIDRVIELAGVIQAISLRGNHEVMILEARTSSNKLHYWQMYGGNETLASYGVTDILTWTSKIPNEHWDFFKSTVPMYPTDSHIFVHANLNPTLGLNQQPESDLYWRFCHDMRPHKSGRHIICGHTSQISGKVKEMGYATCIDTYAVGGKWLTMLDVESGDYWQASQTKDIKTGKLTKYQFESGNG